jgi:hypothetical protein
MPNDPKTTAPKIEKKSALRAALRGLLDEIEVKTCIHEDTHRGGVLWTICDGCGMKWADDEGGFVPHQESAAVQTARALLCQERNHD